MTKHRTPLFYWDFVAGAFLLSLGLVIIPTFFALIGFVFIIWASCFFIIGTYGHQMENLRKAGIE